MKGYLLCFSLTLIFTFLASYNFNKKNKGIGIFFSIFAVLIPSFFTGVRDPNEVAPRDIGMYIIPYLKNAQNQSFFEFINSGISEPGFLMVLYTISSIFKGDIHFILFFIQLFTCLPIYIYAYKMREKISMVFVMFIYLMYWYMIFFTIMRQGIAISIILLSLVYFKEKKYKTTLWLYILAVSFHTSAIVCIIIYIIIYVNNSKYSNIDKFKLNLIILVSAILISLFYDKIVYFLSYTISIFPTKFYNYLISSKYNLEGIMVKKTETLECIICLIIGIYLIFLKKNKKETKENIMLLLINMILVVLSYKIVNINRIGYYFFFPVKFYFYSNFTSLFKRNKLNHIFSSTLIISLILAIWIYKYPIVNEWETYPYKSDIITFLN